MIDETIVLKVPQDDKTGHIYALFEVVAEDVVKLCQDEIRRQRFL